MSISLLFSSRNQRFNAHFSEIAGSMNNISQLFQDAFHDNKEVAEEAHMKIKSEERKLLHTISNLRNESGSSLINPLDREDVYFITSDLRLLSGNILHICGKQKGLGNDWFPQQFYAAVPEISSALADLSLILGGIKDIGKLHQLTDSCRSVRLQLHQCDLMIDEATSATLNTRKDPIELIRMMDHFSAIQNMLEKAGDVINISETIIVKYS